MTRATRSMPAKAADITARKPLANVIHRIDAEVTPRRCIT